MEKQNMELDYMKLYNEKGATRSDAGLDYWVGMKFGGRYYEAMCAIVGFSYFEEEKEYRLFNSLPTDAQSYYDAVKSEGIYLLKIEDQIRLFCEGLNANQKSIDDFFTKLRETFADQIIKGDIEKVENPTISSS